MLDELINLDDDKNTKPDDDDTTPEEELEAYGTGREGKYSIYEFLDKPKEAAARTEGGKDRKNAEETRKEDEQQKQESEDEQ